MIRERAARKPHILALPVSSALVRCKRLALMVKSL